MGSIFHSTFIKDNKDIGVGIESFRGKPGYDVRTFGQMPPSHEDHELTEEQYQARQRENQRVSTNRPPQQNNAARPYTPPQSASARPYSPARRYPGGVRPDGGRKRSVLYWIILILILINVVFPAIVSFLIHFF